LIEELVADSEREDQFQIVLVEDKVRAEGEDGAERSAALLRTQRAGVE